MKLHPIKPTSVVAQSPQQLSTCLDGEVISLSIERGKYFKMDVVGSQIWGMIASPLRVNDLCDRLLKKYSVSAEECETQTISFLEELRRADLATADPK